MIREQSCKASPAQALGLDYEKSVCTRRQTRSRTHPRRPVRCRLPRRHLRLGGISRRHHLGTAVVPARPPLAWEYSQQRGPYLLSPRISCLTKASVSTFSCADHDRTTQVSKYRWASAMASPGHSQGSRSAMQRGHVDNGLGFGARACLPPPPPFQAQPARGQLDLDEVKTFW